MIWREHYYDTHGKPIVGLRVTILDRHPVSHPKSHSPWITLVTDSDGQVEADLDPGEYKIVAAGQETPLTVGMIGGDSA